MVAVWEETELSYQFDIILYIFQIALLVSIHVHT